MQRALHAVHVVEHLQHGLGLGLGSWRYIRATKQESRVSIAKHSTTPYLFLRRGLQLLFLLFMREFRRGQLDG